MILFPSFFRGKIAIHTHKTSSSSIIRILGETFDQIGNSIFIRFSAYIQQHAVLRLQIATEALKEPQVGRKLGSICVLEARK